jgi:hypothetical protein
MGTNPLYLKDMFDPRDDSNIGRIGSKDWNRTVFARAYSHPDRRSGQIDQVIAKLLSGFSVLVYLPGNCMAAAADYVMKAMPNREWKACGQHPGGQGQPMEAWQPANSIVGDLIAWFSAPQGGEPHAIFHNLDLLGDSRGGVLSADIAYSAVFSLIEATRRGVVLGLADRDAGELPAPMQNAFTDQIWLRTIEDGAFRGIIPCQLGEILSTDGKTVPEGPVQQITARLRWSDPIRAVKIMDAVARLKNVRSLGGVLDEIRRRTLPPGYLDPAPWVRDEAKALTGFDEERTVQQLEAQVVRPYTGWTQLESADVELWRRETNKLHQGVVLYGPAGTGKTTLAGWIARRVGLPIRIVSAAEIRRPSYGDAERMVRRTFEEARRAAPCVLVLDDADDLFPRRSEITGSTASADLGIVNAALQELEGVNGPLTGVLVVMTTNRFDHLDEAVKQRLSLHIKVPYPVSDKQVGEIVDFAAESYGFLLTPAVRNKLIEEFLRPVDVNNRRGENQPSATGSDRRRCTSGLFAPRTIVRDMLHLRDGDGPVHPDGRYEVIMDDVNRLQAYHEQYHDEHSPTADRRG